MKIEAKQRLLASKLDDHTISELPSKLGHLFSSLGLKWHPASQVWSSDSFPTLGEIPEQGLPSTEPLHVSLGSKDTGKGLMLTVRLSNATSDALYYNTDPKPEAAMVKLMKATASKLKKIGTVKEVRLPSSKVQVPVLQVWVPMEKLQRK